MRTPKIFIALMGIVELLFASPAAKASATIGGTRITVSYGAPSVRGRQIFGDGGLVSKDWTYPVWRAGANAATTLFTGGDLDAAALVARADEALYQAKQAGRNTFAVSGWHSDEDERTTI